MYTKDELGALKQREQELVSQIATLREELRKIRKVFYARKSYEKAYGEVREYQGKKTPEELREYNRIKQREWRAKHKRGQPNESDINSV